MPDHTIVDGKIPYGTPATYAAQLRNAIAAAMFGSGVPTADPGAIPQLYIDKDSGILYLWDGVSWEVSFAASGNTTYFLTEMPLNAFGADGDQAVIYTLNGDITGLAEKSGGVWTRLATQHSAPPEPQNVLNIVDDFVGGIPSIPNATTGLCGGLNWYYHQVAGSAGALRVSNPTTITAGVFGALRIITGTVSGNRMIMYFPGQANVYAIDIRKLSGFFMEWKFKLNDGTQYDADYWLGFMNASNPVTDADPTRFAGIRCLAASANFDFACINASAHASGSPYNTGVAKDLLWHTFRMTWNGTNWLMSLDGAEAITVTNNIAAGSSVTIGVHVVARSTSQPSLYLDRFQMYGVYPIPV